MKSLCLNALVAFLAILWAINVEAATKDIGDPIDEIKIKVTPSCFVVGAPVEFVVVNTEIPIEKTNTATFELWVNDEVFESDDIEADGRGELVVKFPFKPVSEAAAGTDEMEICFWIIFPDTSDLSACVDVKVHDYSKPE
jgi:hypothetical protein